ncbi:MAG: hypothetical protein ACR2MK_00630 [Solirubrobacteraceae bacterium]
MSDQSEIPVAPGEPPASDAPAAPSAAEPVADWTPPPPLPEPDSGASAASRPEIAVGAAFAGGLALALVLKRLAR